MAVTVTNNMTLINACDATTNWSNGPNTHSGFNREGSNCLGLQTSNDTVHSSYTLSGSTDLSSSRIYVWFKANTSVDTKANGGFRISLHDGTNERAYYVGGSDDYGFQVKDWTCFLLDTANLPSNFAQLTGSVAPTLTAITQVGIGIKSIIKATGNVDNFFWDVLRYIPNSSYALTVGGGGVGTEGKFSEIASDDASKASGKAYGIIRQLQNGVFSIQGNIEFGDSGTASTYFDEEDSILVFEDRLIDTTDGYLLKLTGNSTGTNEFILGNKVGTGDTAVGSNGCTIQSAGPKLTINLDDANYNTVNIYGSKFLGVDGGITLSSTATDEFIGNTVDQSGQVVANQCVIRNCTFSGTTHSSSDGSALLWNGSIDIKNCSFNANTDVTNDPHGIEHDTAGTFNYDNLTFSGNDFDIEFSAASGDLTVEKLNGSNPSTSEITSTGNSVTISASFTHTLTGLQENTEVTYVKVSDGSVLFNVENVDISGETTYTHSGGETVDILIHHLDYVPDISNIYNLTLPNSDATVPVSQIQDNFYNNP